MNELTQAVNPAVFNSIREPFTAVIAVFAVLTAVTVLFVAREIINRK